MEFRNTWKKLTSILDFLYNFDWEEIKKDPDKRAKVSMLFFAAQILVTASIVIGTLFFIYLRIFT